MASSGAPRDLHDDETLIASPVDGFFNSQPPPTVLVEDPSLKDTDADKSLHLSSHSFPRQQNEPFYKEEWPGESSVLLPSAPPTYSAATAGSSGRIPTGSNSSDQASPYSGTDDHVKGRPEISPPHAELKDSGSSREPSMPKKDGWRQKLRKDFSRYDRRLGRSAAILMAVLLGIVFITHTCSSIVHRKSPNHHNPDHTEFSNIRKVCPACIYSNSTMFTFNRPSKFAFAQAVHNVIETDGGLKLNHVQTRGEIHVRLANNYANQKTISVELKTFSSDPSLHDFEVVEKKDEELRITTPRTIRPSFASAFEETRPCIYIGATIWIPRGLTISDLRIATESLSVRFHEDLHLSVRNLISIRAESGTVKLPFHRSNANPASLHIDSLSTNVVARSGSVEGDFVLRDTLSIHTSSGSININVKLQKGTSGKPAVLDVKSNSGSIHVNMPTIASEIPDRDYRVTIEDMSGSIDANVVHGSSTRIKNISGRISAELYPYGPNTSRSDIYTDDKSGSTDVTVHDSLSHPNSPLRKLYASHRSISGSLSLAYPGQWEGKVEGGTVSGTVSTVWPGLEIIRDHRGLASHRLEAVKGHGEGIIAFHGVSGSVYLQGERGSTGMVRAWQDGEDDTETEVGDGVLTPQGGEDEEWEEMVWRGE